jgi:threonine synthase
VSEWHLECSACGHTEPASARATVCPKCGQPFLVRYDSRWPPRDAIGPRWDMWRYRAVLPIRDGEEPVSLGEGATPLVDAPELARQLGVAGLVVPTAGNAGAALAAYGAAARLPVRVYAPASTPAPILDTVRAFGAELELVDGHIGDAGRLARAFAESSGYFDVSTLREPYRIEGKKTMGLEIAEQLGWRLPSHVVYPTGGGTGLIGMWKVFAEMRDGGWLARDAALPHMIAAQAAGCAPIVRAFAAGASSAQPWEDPGTHASGHRVPAPLAHRCNKRALRESAGEAAAASEEEIRRDTARLARATGVDAAPEGGCALAVLTRLVDHGSVPREAEVVLFNTGSGASYRG